MSTQISLKLSDKMIVSARKYSESHGFDTLQDFIRETLRQLLFEKKKVSGLYTAIASETSLAKKWMSKEEDAAWEHLQKEM
jgi:hypothetical protein